MILILQMKLCQNYAGFRRLFIDCTNWDDGHIAFLQELFNFCATRVSGHDLGDTLKPCQNFLQILIQGVLTNSWSSTVFRRAQRLIKIEKDSERIHLVTNSGHYFTISTFQTTFLARVPITSKTFPLVLAEPLAFAC